MPIGIAQEALFFAIYFAPAIVSEVGWICLFPDMAWFLSGFPAAQSVSQHLALQFYLVRAAQTVARLKILRMEGARWPGLPRFLREDRNHDSGDADHLDLTLDCNCNPVTERSAGGHENGIGIGA